MSKLDKLFGKPKVIELEGELFEIFPLEISDLSLIMQLEDPDKMPTAMAKIVKKTLQKAVPDATEEEVSKVGLKHFKKLSTAIMEVNGLANEDKKPLEPIKKE